MSLFNYIKSHLSIVDIVTEHVNLRPVGSYMKGPCPFHAERDASFTVSPSRQIFYCFGCQASGDVIAFMAKIENFSQIESAHYLIDRYKLSVPQELLQKAGEPSQTLQEKESFFHICATIASWAYQQCIQNNQAFAYLEKRRLTPEIIKKFSIGYFPGGVSNINLFLKAMAREGVMAKDLISHGIISESRSQLYSAFEERIIFPIFDSLGRGCGFGGRIFKIGDERAKYYNSRESDYFIKGKVLFGFDLAKKSMHEKEFAFLVEGYLDCIVMVQHGYTNTVATLGTACSLEHLKLLSRHIKTLYVIYDGDDAGQNAMLRLTELCWGVNLELKVIQLSSKEDPASFLSGAGDLTPYILNAQDIFTFFIQTLSANFLNKTLSEKVALAEKITNIIARINDEFKQDILLQQAAMIMQLPTQSLKALTLKQRHRHSYEEHSAEAEQQPHLPAASEEQDVCALEEKIFSAIISSAGREAALLTITNELLPFFSVRVQAVFKIYELIRQQTQTDIWSAFLGRLDEQNKAWVLRIALKYDDVVSQESFEQLVAHFCKLNWKNIVKQIKEEIQEARLLNDAERLNEVLGTFLKLKQGIQSRGLI
jgi:DNA primase